MIPRFLSLFALAVAIAALAGCVASESDGGGSGLPLTDDEPRTHYAVHVSRTGAMPVQIDLPDDSNHALTRAFEKLDTRDFIVYLSNASEAHVLTAELRALTPEGHGAGMSPTIRWRGVTFTVSVPDLVPTAVFVLSRAEGDGLPAFPEGHLMKDPILAALVAQAKGAGQASIRVPGEQADGTVRFVELITGDAAFPLEFSVEGAAYRLTLMTT